MPFASTVKVARGKDVVSRQMDESGNSVLLHLRSGYVYTCGEVGTFIWEALKKPATVGDLVQTICGEFDVEEDAALDDLQRFLKDLVAERLVTIDDKPHA